MKAKGTQLDTAALAGKLETDGGFTVTPRTGTPVTTGISVAPRENEREHTPATASDISTYVSDNAERFKNKSTMLGGWRGPESDFLDTPTVHPHTPGGGGEARARKQMVLSHQVAAYNIDTDTEIYNPYHPVGRSELKMPSHELADAAHPKEGESTEKARSRSDWVAKQPEVQAWINHPRGGPPG